MNTQKYQTFTKQREPLIRHCWMYNVYKINKPTISYKEKFVNFLIKDGKKAKAYKLFNKIGILIKKKITHSTIKHSEDIKNQSFDSSSISKDKNIQFFDTQNEGINKLKKYAIKHIAESKKKYSILEVSKKIVSKNIIKNPLMEKREKDNKLVNKNIKKKIKRLSFNTTISKEEVEVKENKVLSFNTLLVRAINNVKPSIEVRKVRVGRNNYLVPAIIREKRQLTLAIKWILDSAQVKKQKNNFSFAENLANELIDAYMKQGHARQKRDELHKLAQTNRAYTRYRWW